MEEQLDLACEKAISVEAASAEATVRFKGELARLQRECNLSRQRMATAGIVVTILHKGLEVVTGKISN